jgi:hypothetical protein
MLGIRGGFAGENHGETGWIFMIKPFETWQTSQTCGSLEFVLSFFAKASKPTGDSPQVPRLLVSHMFPAVAVQRAQWFRKSDYSGKNA